MKQFDTQRLESLMRHTEFLRDMKAADERINQVIDVIHREIIGYIPEVNETTLYGDGQSVYKYLQIHPEVQRYVKGRIKIALEGVNQGR